MGKGCWWHAPELSPTCSTSILFKDGWNYFTFRSYDKSYTWYVENDRTYDVTNPNKYDWKNKPTTVLPWTNANKVLFGGSWNPITSYTTAIFKLQGFIHSINLVFNYTATNWQILGTVQAYDIIGIKILDLSNVTEGC